MARNATNLTLKNARSGKNDEFYTVLSDVEKELKHYRPHFEGKVVLCNCDDPRISNFFHYFSCNLNYGDRITVTGATTPYGDRITVTGATTPKLRCLTLRPSSTSAPLLGDTQSFDTSTSSALRMSGRVPIARTLPLSYTNPIGQTPRQTGAGAGFASCCLYP